MVGEVILMSIVGTGVVKAEEGTALEKAAVDVPLVRAPRREANKGPFVLVLRESRKESGRRGL